MTATEHAPMHRQRLWRRVGTIASVTALVVSVVVASLMIVPSLLGYQRYVIVSGSMVPTLPIGSVVYDEIVPVAELEVGDIITFVPPPEYGVDDPVTHRIVEIGRGADDSDQAGRLTFRTKGDANESMDAWTMVLDGPDQARVVHHVPYVGYVYIALSNRWIQLLLIGLPALGIAAFVLISLWRLSGAAVEEERARQQVSQDHAGATP